MKENNTIVCIIRICHDNYNLQVYGYRMTKTIMNNDHLKLERRK